MTETLKTKSETLMQLWSALIPNFCPTEQQFNLWLVTYDLDEKLVEWGVKETALKFQKKKGNMDDEYLVKFMSSILRTKYAKTQVTQ
jgi:hypothetical protein